MLRVQDTPLEPRPKILRLGHNVPVLSQPTYRVGIIVGEPGDTAAEHMQRIAIADQAAHPCAARRGNERDLLICCGVTAATVGQEVQQPRHRVVTPSAGSNSSSMHRDAPAVKARESRCSYRYELEI